MKRYICRVCTVMSYVLLFLAISEIKVAAETKWPGYKINSKLSIPELALDSNTYIIDYKRSDINGDKDKEDVFLAGEKESSPEDPYSANICIIVKDGKTNAYTKIDPGEITVGFKSNMFLGDFNNDGIDDIFISIGNDMESKSSAFSLISFKDNTPQKLFEQETFAKGLYFSFFYKDNFKVDIYNKDVNKSFLIDLTPYKDYYVDNKIYGEKGKLLKEPDEVCGSIGQLLPVDIDKDGVFELKGTQSLLCEKDLKLIARGETVWKYRKNKFNIEVVKVVNIAN